MYYKGKGKSHLTAEERGKVEAYLNAGYSISQVARELGRAKSTVSEEIKRSKWNDKYKADIATRRAKERSINSHKHSKWRDTKLLWIIGEKLKQKLSPEAISAILRMDYGIKFSHTSICKLIKKHRPEWSNYLIYKGKRRRRNVDKSVRTLIPDRVDISERPEEVNNRSRTGDWEADTVISSRGGRSCLAVFVERKSRYYLIEKIENKGADMMKRATLKALKEKIVKTITYDNGTENVFHKEINEILGCESYFCRPYRSCDKGQIENRNKQLRQFLPKKTNFDLISEEEIRRVQDRINSRPMKRLGWKSPAQVFLSFGF